MEFDPVLKQKAINRWKLSYQQRMNRIVRKLINLEQQTTAEQAVLYQYIKPHYEALIEEANKRDIKLRAGDRHQVALVLKDVFYPAREPFTVRQITAELDRRSHKRISAVLIQHHIDTFVREGHLYKWSMKFQFDKNIVEAHYQFMLYIDDDEPNGQKPQHKEQLRRARAIYVDRYGSIERFK